MKTEKQIQKAIDKKAKRGGKVYLPANCYTVDRSIVIDTPSFTLEGESWACNIYKRNSPFDFTGRGD